MKAFLDEDFLLSTATARTLYHEVAKAQPICDYHCHLSAKDIFENRQATDIGALWLDGDHYKWRLMRANGVPERQITGDAPMREKFCAYAAALEQAIGNPLYVWSHLELKRYFDIDTPLTRRNAEEIYERANAVMQSGDFRPQSLIVRSRVTALCTTDDPADTLEYHNRLKKESAFPVSVLPTFRPDRAIQIHKPDYPAYLLRLGESSGVVIDSVNSLKQALTIRLDHFQRSGCVLSDHGLDRLVFRPSTGEALEAVFCRARHGEAVSAAEAEAFMTDMLLYLAGEYRKRHITMQLHFGGLRNPSARMLRELGPDTGFDSMGDAGSASALKSLLNAMESADALPQAILYPLNPHDNEAVLSVMGAFQTDGARLQFGSAWWFADHYEGMVKQMKDLASLGLLGRFVGMLTDSRSYLSYTRHEYFRRILCRLIGEWAERGEYPGDITLLEPLVQNICYGNIRRFLGI